MKKGHGIAYIENRKCEYIVRTSHVLSLDTTHGTKYQVHGNLKMFQNYIVYLDIFTQEASLTIDDDIMTKLHVTDVYI